MNSYRPTKGKRKLFVLADNLCDDALFDHIPVVGVLLPNFTTDNDLSLIIKTTDPDRM